MTSVRYKYRNESEQIINNATSATVQSTNLRVATWVAYGIYRDEIRNQNFIWTCDLEADSGTVDRIISDSVPRFINTYWVMKVPDGRVYAIRSSIENASNIDNYSQPNTYEVGSYRIADGTSNQAVNTVGILSKYNYGKNYERLDYVLNAPVLRYFHPLRLLPQYRFDVFRNNTLVFSRIEDYPPEYYRIEGNNRECPSNTCPVQCNSYVYCYGSDGIAIETFLLSESIYQ